MEVPLRTRGSVCAHALIDESDAELARVRWSVNSNGYAVRSVWEDGRTVPFLMHRVILGLVAGDGLEVDHINGDKLDNRRGNLRVVTHAQQTQNMRKSKNKTSRFRGVSWERSGRPGGRWRARPRIDGRYYHLGYFSSEIEAAKAAQAWRDEHMPFAEPDPALAAALAS